MALILSHKVIASSDYVLPYPSFMPGNKLYSVHRIYEGISKYWYFGDYGRFIYYLNLSDRYLVEAKTLFDYKQYLLAVSALNKSNEYFKDASNVIKKVKKNGVEQKLILLKSAGKKHIEELEKISNITPEVFKWTPEKVASSQLQIEALILNSIGLRKTYE